MKRLFIILLSCLCLTACHKNTTTKSTEKTTAEDSILLESIKRATLQYVDQLNQQYEEDPIEPTNVSVRWSRYPDKMVLVSFNDVNYTLALVDYQDTTISDILSDFYDVECDKIYGIGLSDSVKIRNHFKRGYQLNDQLLTISDSNIYILKDYRARSITNHNLYILEGHRAEPITGRDFSDTLLFELSETTYSIVSGKFVKTQHRDTTLRHHQWTVKSYFREPNYNNYLTRLSEKIMRNDSITDEELLQAMPKNEEQYFVYSPENYPYGFRAVQIDSMAIARSKNNPLFRDAYIRMYPWSDGAGAEILYEGHFMYFFHLDSVYFRNAVRRIIPEYADEFEDDSIYDEKTGDVGWLRWTREHKEEILDSYSRRYNH